MRWFIALTSMFLFWLSTASAQFVRPSDAELAMLRRYVESERDRWQIPGLSVAVLHRGDVAFRMDLGEADIELGVAVSGQSVFEIGSISKQFVATAVMILRKEGRLDLADPIHRHLPELPSEWRGVTILHLLTHTSGIPDYESAMGYGRYRDRMTADRVIEWAHSLPMSFAPGDGYEYSNTGYYLLSMLVERVTESSLDAYLRSNVFEPLGMDQTGLASAHEIVPGRVSGYERNGLHQLRNRDASQVSSTQGAGGILTTIEDLAKWDRALYGGDVLPQSVLAEMWMPGQLNDGSTTNYGYGWRVEPFAGHPEQYHYGMTAGFVANMTRLPDDETTAIVLGNRYEARITPLVLALLHAFIPSLGPSGIDGAPR